MKVIKDWKKKAVVQVGNFIARWPSPKRGIKSISRSSYPLIKMTDLPGSVLVKS